MSLGDSAVICSLPVERRGIIAAYVAPRQFRFGTLCKVQTRALHSVWQDSQLPSVCAFERACHQGAPVPRCSCQRLGLSLTPFQKRPRLQCGQSMEANPQDNRFGSCDKTVLLPAYVRHRCIGANGKLGSADESVGTLRRPNSDEVPTSGIGTDPDGGG